MSNVEQNVVRGVKNGVDLDALEANVNAITEDPGLGQFRFQVRNRWESGGHNRITIDEYSGVRQEFSREVPFELEADEPEVLLGKDLGPNPVEYLLGALSGCMTTTLAYHGSNQGAAINAIESSHIGQVDLRGLLKISENVRPGFSGIDVHFKVDSDLTASEIEELVKGSPVYDMLVNPVPVNITVEKA